jgi:xylulokinase
VFLNVNYNLHDDAHLVRAVQEGVAFSFAYGMEIMKTVGLDLSVIRAGRANMFLSPVFTRMLAGVTGVTIELYNTDGAQGAARGAAIGGGVAASFGEAFRGLKRVAVVEPDAQRRSAFAGAYGRWKNALALFLNK